MCGDHKFDYSCKFVIWGSPPHVRGPPEIFSLIKEELGITPACAGTTRCMAEVLQNARDHPRMCGDHA